MCQSLSTLACLAAFWLEMLSLCVRCRHHVVDSHENHHDLTLVEGILYDRARFEASGPLTPLFWIIRGTASEANTTATWMQRFRLSFLRCPGINKHYNEPAGQRYNYIMDTPPPPTQQPRQSCHYDDEDGFYMTMIVRFLSWSSSSSAAQPFPQNQSAFPSSCIMIT